MPAVGFQREEGNVGIKCTVNGHVINIGNRACLEVNGIEIRPGTLDAMEYLEDRGRTAIALAVDGKTEAVLGLIDTAKDEAAFTINVLKAMGIKVMMVTGDNFRTARVVAADIGISPQNVVAGVLPEGKVDCIKRLQRAGECVGFIGDGTNDAGALAQSHIGIAVGCGTDVAIESAGVVLVNSKLTDVIVAIHLARTIYSRIRLNFVWALGYNSLAIPIASGVLYPIVHMALPPFMAAIAMAMSSLSVLLSSLLLNRYRPPQFDKKYGRYLRDGELGLEKISMILPNGSHAVLPVTCYCMEDGGECKCPPGECKCGVDCRTHCKRCTSTSGAEKDADANVYYPGCQTSWGQPCSCSFPCRCAGCTCKNAIGEEAEDEGNSVESATVHAKSLYRGTSDNITTTT